MILERVFDIEYKIKLYEGGNKMKKNKVNYRVRPYSIAWFAGRLGEFTGLFLTLVGGSYLIIFLGY